MSTNTHRTDKSSGTAARVRPAYIRLGVDEREASHVYDTRTETVHIIHPDGSRGRRCLNGQPIEAWVDAVADGWGWDERTYGRDVLFDQLEEITRGER